MQRILRGVRYLCLCPLPLFLLVACSSLRPQTADSECGPLIDCPPAKAGCHPIRVCDNPTVLTLAADLDHLERHIDWYGSVVAKVPDVWGQARLTQYRDEFEKTMAKEVENFEFSLQGSLARSDAAYFASATALSFAAQPKSSSAGGGGKGDGPTLVPAGALTGYYRYSPNDPSGIVRSGGITRYAPPASKASAPAPAAASVKPLEPGDAAGMVSETDTVIGARNAARLPDALPFGQAVGHIGIEPTEYLAQKKRYLDFLAQLRRENEGDDTADSPGYSLNLMRVPVSVLPGKRTNVGFGAEITMTITPALGDDLLPTTFRNLVVNDVVTQLGFPLTQVLDGDDFQAILTPETKRVIAGIDLIRRWTTKGLSHKGEITAVVVSLSDVDRERVRVAVNSQLAERKVPEEAKETGYAQLIDGLSAVLAKFTEQYRRTGQRMGCDDPIPPPPPSTAREPSSTNVTPTAAQQPPMPSSGQFLVRPNASPYSPLGSIADSLTSPPIPRPRTRPGTAASPPPSVSAAARNVLNQLKVPSLSFANGLDNRVAIPTSQLFDVYGEANLFAIGFGAVQALGTTFNDQGYAHLPDVQSYLREEARAAYQFLAQPSQLGLWSEFCTPELVTVIRTRQIARLQDMRDDFRCRVEALTQTDRHRLGRPDNELMQFSTTAALAWCIVVDSALLTDRLVRDMKETASAKGKPLPGCDRWCPYFLPDPPAECRQMFNEYVKVRWPIHVFALDPYIQEQNIADSLSTRREMQLALAIAFTNGQIGARNMTKYVRRLEAEYQTVTLNRTQVGFSHGENVFGWRFYPRFQTPDTKSNLEVLFREQLIGGPNRNQLMRDHRLEPGMRECVAVVMMPSFVPYVTVDTASNWFPLPNPKHKVLDTTDAVKLSRAVQTIKTCAGQVRDADCYRDGEFTRLVRRSEQLEARLPLQTQISPVPILNNYGGFEMFANGTSDLAPELYGWYGAPGIDPTAESTTLFLVGDHFSPLRTRVIVGNQAVDNTDMKAQSLLSRQVMQVTFAKGAYPVTNEKGAATSVRVHVATPYGVTRELDIPVVKQSPKANPTPGFSFGDAKLTAYYGIAGAVDPAGKAVFTPVAQGADAEIKMNWVAPGNALPPRVEVAFEFPYQGATLKVPVVGEVKDKSVVIPKGEASRLAAELVCQIATATPTLPVDPNPLAKGLTSSKVTVRPLAPPPILTQGVETTDQLKVEFKATGVCPPGMPPVHLPALPHGQPHLPPHVQLPQPLPAPQSLPQVPLSPTQPQPVPQLAPPPSPARDR